MNTQQKQHKQQREAEARRSSGWCKALGDAGDVRRQTARLSPLERMEARFAARGWAW